MLNSPSVNALRAMSLDTIRGFESAARHLSFTAAAEELHLTQSAVSKQVKSLEDALDTALFLRGGKGLSLTPEGRQLFEAARAALTQLAAAVDGLLSVERLSVSVTTTPSFAALWLAPKLAKFQTLEPAIDVRVDASEARVNLEREGLDLAVRLNPPQSAGEGTPTLLQEQALLVAAPAVAARAAAGVLRPGYALCVDVLDRLVPAAGTEAVTAAGLPVFLTVRACADSRRAGRRHRHWAHPAGAAPARKRPAPGGVTR